MKVLINIDESFQTTETNTMHTKGCVSTTYSCCSADAAGTLGDSASSLWNHCESTDIVANDAIGMGHISSGLLSKNNRAAAGYDYLSVPDLRPASTENRGTSNAGATPNCQRYRSGEKKRPFTDESEISDDEEDCGADLDDDCLSSEGTFESAVINVCPTEGCVILDYPEYMQQVHTDTSVENEDGCSNTTVLVDSDETSDSCGSISEEGNVVTEENDIRFEPHHFELQPTNVHSAEDVRKREHDNVRVAVLGAAAEAYKNVHLEVPDMIIAQINEIRETIRRGAAQDDFLNPESEHIVDFNAKRLEMSCSENTHARGPRKRTKASPDRNWRALRRQDQRGSTYPQNKKVNKKELKRPSSKIKKLALTSQDEIHVLPCQCALTLVGMRGFNILFPITSPTSNDAGDLVESFACSLFEEKASERRPNPPTSCFPSGKQPHTWRNFQFFVNKSERASQNKKIVHRTPPRKAAHSSAMVRTSSGKAQETKSIRPTAPMTMHQVKAMPTQWSRSSADDSSFKLGGPPDLINPMRSRSGTGESLFPPICSHTLTSQQQKCDSSSFTSMGYHEIVLIRKSAVTEKEDHHVINWDAVTIRCSNHDEMDILIEALKTCANSTVVPFSPNPKAKLIRTKERGLTLSKKRRCVLNPRGRRKRNGKGGNFDAIVSSSYTMCPAPQHQALTDKMKNKYESNKWNRCKMCEICHLHFTFIIRRHHCRKCDRSCCGGCSSVLLLRDGEAKRYCKHCSPEIDGKAKYADDSWNKHDHCEVCKQVGNFLSAKEFHHLLFMHQCTYFSSFPITARILLSSLAVITVGSVTKAVAVTVALFFSYEVGKKSDTAINVPQK